MRNRTILTKMILLAKQQTSCLEVSREGVKISKLPGVLSQHAVASDRRPEGEGNAAEGPSSVAPTRTGGGAGG